MRPQQKIIRGLGSLGFRVVREKEHFSMVRDNLDGSKTPLTVPNHPKPKGVDVAHDLYAGRNTERRVSQVLAGSGDQISIVWRDASPFLIGVPDPGWYPPAKFRARTSWPCLSGIALTPDTERRCREPSRHRRRGSRRTRVSSVPGRLHPSLRCRGRLPRDR